MRKAQKIKITVILLGATLSVLSAAIGHFQLKSSHVAIEQKQVSKSKLENEIHDLWQNQQAESQKVDFATVLIGLSALDQGESFTGYVSETLGVSKDQLQGESQENLFQLLKDGMQQGREKSIALINDKYFNVLELEKEISSLNSHNESLGTLILLLQIFGLILVLSKDIVPTR